MAITYWPKHGEANTEASFAAYADKLFGYADHASSDTAFMALYTSNDGTNDTYTISAGSYMFNGYLFTAAGTETLVVDDGTSVDCYLYYHLDGSDHIDACGVCKYADIPAGAVSLKLWNFNTGVITDYRQILTWGRQSVADTSANCTDFLSTTETALAGGATSYSAGAVKKRFRAGYPGTVSLALDVYCDGGAGTPNTYGAAVYRVRGGSATLLTTLTVSIAAYESKTYTVSGLQAGDYIDIQGNSGSLNYKFKNFRIRYITADTPTAAVLVD